MSSYSSETSSDSDEEFSKSFFHLPRHSLSTAETPKEQLSMDEVIQLEHMGIEVSPSSVPKSSQKPHLKERSPRLELFQKYCETDKFFLYERNRNFNTVSSQLGVTVPNSVLYDTIVFCESKPTLILTCISSEDEGKGSDRDAVEEYNTLVAREITRYVRENAIPNFTVVNGIMTEDDFKHGDNMKFKLEEFAEFAVFSSFPQYLVLDRSRCRSALRSFLTMMSIESLEDVVRETGTDGIKDLEKGKPETNNSVLESSTDLEELIYKRSLQVSPGHAKTTLDLYHKVLQNTKLIKYDSQTEIQHEDAIQIKLISSRTEKLKGNYKLKASNSKEEREIRKLPFWISGVLGALITEMISFFND